MPRADKIGLVALFTLTTALMVYLLWPRSSGNKVTAPTASEPSVNLDGTKAEERASLDSSQGENKLFSVDKAAATSNHTQATGPTIVQVF